MAGNALTFSLFGKDVSAGKTLDDVGNKAEKAGGMFAGMAKVAGGALVAMGVSAGLGAVKDYLGASVEAYKEAELAQLQLTDAYSKFPAVSSVSIDALRALNTELASKTRFDDDALASGQAVLAQFDLTGEQIQQLTPLMADYAARTGQDIPSAADALGKAMLGQGKALKSIGIDFKDAGSTGANFDQVMAGLSSQVGGFAEKDGAAGAGMAERLKNQMGELQETIGAGLLPIIYQLQSAFLTYVVPVLSAVAENVSGMLGPAFTGLIAVVMPIAQQLGAILGPIIAQLAPQVISLVTAFSPLSILLQALQPVLPILAQLLQTVGFVLSSTLASVLPVVTTLVQMLVTVLSGVLMTILPIIAQLIYRLATIFGELMPVLGKVALTIGSTLMMALQAMMPAIAALAPVLNYLLNALFPLIGPILEIVMAFMPLITILGQLIGALLPPLVQLFMAVLDPILTLVPTLVTLLVPALKWVAEAIGVVIGWISGALQPVLENLPGIISTVAGVVRDVFGGIADFIGDVFKNVANFIVGGMNTVIDIVNGVIGIVNDLGKTASSVTGGAISWKVAKLPKIPALAQGGIVSAATLAMIGEGSEPEVVAPLSKLPGIAAQYANANGGGSDRPIMMDGHLIGLLREMANGEAQLVFADQSGATNAALLRGRR